MFGAAAGYLCTCRVNFFSDVRNQGLREELEMTDELKIAAPVITGYPASIPQAPRRESPVLLNIINC